MRPTAIVSVLAIAAIAVIGIAIAEKGDAIEGSGNVTSQARNVQDFHRVSVGGAISADIHVGAATHVEVRCDDNIEQYVETKVEDGTLMVSMKGDESFFSARIHVLIATPTLDGLDVRGASTVNTSDVKTDDLKVHVSGASHAEVSGAAANLECRVSGASTLSASTLKSSSVEVNCSGASKASVFAEKELSANASGASTITYSGPATQVSRSSSGASSIEKE